MLVDLRGFYKRRMNKMTNKQLDKTIKELKSIAYMLEEVNRGVN